jgi:hypothetical protein
MNPHCRITQNSFFCSKSCVLWLFMPTTTRAFQPLGFLLSPWLCLCRMSCRIWPLYLGNLYKDPRPLPTPTFLTQSPTHDLIFNVWQDHGSVIHSPAKGSHDALQMLAMNKAAITIQVGPIPLAKTQELQNCSGKECLVNCY